MHHRTLYLIVSVLSALISSCSSDKDVIPTPIGAYLTVENGLRPLSASGGEGVLRFSTDEAWRIETETGDMPGDWFGIDPSQGGAGEHIAVTVRVDENPTYVGRSFTLTVRTASLERSVEVSQLKRNAIIAGENHRELSAEGQTLTIEIQSNVEYEIGIAEGGEWIEAAEGSRAEPGLTAAEHRFSVAANTDPQPRTARILFKDLASDLQDEVTVVQAAMADPDPERTALRAIYREANGGGWTNSDNWCSDRPTGEWYGVATDDEGHVVELRLPQNNLRGAIAHEIANLSHLRILDMSRNGLECELVYERPEDYELLCDLDGLTELEEINLSHNKLKSCAGGVPALQNMPSLRLADLSYNQLDCWISDPAWAPLFENGRTVDLIFNGNNMSGNVAGCITNHPEWDRLALQIVRQYYPSFVEYDKEIHVPEFTFTDLRTGARQSIRALCAENERTMILAWDPTDEKSIRFAERSVRRYHKLYGAQGLAVVAITPEGDRYKQAAEQYLATHEVEWPVVADYADDESRRIRLDMEPYPSYLLFDREGMLVEDVFTGAYGNVESIVFDLDQREFEYANYMNEWCHKVFGECTYESTDYSMDKKTELLQRASRGKGIDIVLIGDVYTDVDIRTGYYRDVMEFAMEAFFSVEPTKSYREYFNVHMVYAVSLKRHIGSWSYNSALGTETFPDKIGIRGNPYSVDKYLQGLTTATKIIPIIVINGDARGRFTMFESPTDTYAYVGFVYYDSHHLTYMLKHEAIGHGFGLLGDEYLHPGSGLITTAAKNRILSYHKSGSFLNLSLTNDPKSVPWAHLIGHPRYPEVGIYEGGDGYEQGVWTSSPWGGSTMGVGSNFNVCCRELIVKRILTLAGEEYTFEKFLEKDILPEQPSSTPKHTSMDMEYVHHPPIFMDDKN